MRRTQDGDEPDTGLPPTLVYPARAPERGGVPTGTTREATGVHLARLLGDTRAAVLGSVGGNCTTSELAERAGVSVSSASEHAAVLRRAGLIQSNRERNAVRHMLTPVGLALLEQGPASVLSRQGAGAEQPQARRALTTAAG